MNALRIETVITGETLVLPQLKPWQGKTVEILVTEVAPKSVASIDSDWSSPLAGTVTQYIDPLAAAVTDAEWEAAR